MCNIKSGESIYYLGCPIPPFGFILAKVNFVSDKLKSERIKSSIEYVQKKMYLKALSLEFDILLRPEIGGSQ